jgi:hypothetical protein
MKNQFSTYEIALALKELGFDKKCLGYYHNQVEPSFCNNLDRGNSVTNSESRYILYPQDCSAPLWQQAIDWFREEHNILIFPHHCLDGITFMVVSEGLCSKERIDQVAALLGDRRKNILSNDFYKEREKAVLKAIELCKSKMSK